MSEPSADERGWREWVRVGGALPGDGVAVLAFLLAANAALYTGVAREPAVRALFGLPLLFFVPGYAVVSALFPTRATGDEDRLRWSDGAGLRPAPESVSWRERLALAVGTSVAVVPLLAVGLSVVGLSYGTDVVVTSLSAVGVAGMSLAVVRRRAVPAHRRFRLPTGRWLDAAKRGLTGGPSRVDGALNVALAVVVVLSLATVGAALVTPNGGETYSAITLLTADGQGNLVASGYPDEIDADGADLVFRVDNREGRTITYTVVAELQRVERSAGEVRPVERREVVRRSERVGAGGHWTSSHEVRPALAGENRRLVYYLYRGDAPPEPTTETADGYAHVWVDVPESGGS